MMKFDFGLGVMDIEKHLYPREAIEQLGIAPMTSMFSCGTHQRRMCDTIHPQIHDSDRLTMWRGNGEWVCRPLNNPPVLQYNAFADESPKGFGLLQTERDFEAYEDVIGNYHERPSLWIEPRSDWGKGEIQLMEIPTTGETMDNVVAFWKPAAPVEATRSRSVAGVAAAVEARQAKGAGAGAAVTARGVFGDILKLSEKK